MARIAVNDLPSQISFKMLPQETNVISLSSRMHTCSENGHRIITPSQTIKRIQKFLRNSNIRLSLQRVYSGSGNRLDKHFFVHKVSSDILLDNFGKNYALGKGLTRDQSLSSGMCELIERFSATVEQRDQFIKRSVKSLSNEGKEFIHPASMGLPDARLRRKKRLDSFHEDCSLNWSEGVHLIKKKPVLVPIVYSYLFPPNFNISQDRIVENRPNGLATGNCLEEAILQAILEIVERDAQAIFIWNQLPMPNIDLKTIKNKKNINLNDSLKALHANGLKIILKNITSDIIIPTIYAFGVDESNKGPAFQWGVGTHLEPAIAVSRALTELIQVRNIFTKFKKLISLDALNHHSENCLSANEESIQLLKFMYLDALESVSYILKATSTISFDDIPDYSNPDLLKEIYYCLDQIKIAGLTDVIAVNHTRLNPELPVVRVIIPGMEFIPWAEYQTNNPYKRRLMTVPSLLGYRSFIDYIPGSGRGSNFLL